MNLTAILGALLVGLLGVGLAGWQGYEYGLSTQKTRDTAAQVPDYVQALKDVKEANDRADRAQTELADATQRYAISLEAEKGRIHETIREVPKYVAANPAPADCDLPDFLFDRLNEAAAETARPPLR